MPLGIPRLPLPAGRYDRAERRRAKRSGREKGCWTYIPAEELLAAGFDPDGPPPLYRTWGDRRGSVLVRLYVDDRDPQPPVEAEVNFSPDP